MTKYKKDSLIFRQNENCDAIYMVKSGAVLVFKEIDNRIIPLKLAKERDFLGEDALINKTYWGVTGVTLEETELVKIEKGEMENFLKEAPKWIEKVVKTLADRIYQTNNLISEHKIVDQTLFEGLNIDAQFESKIQKIIRDSRSQ